MPRSFPKRWNFTGMNRLTCIKTVTYFYIYLIATNYILGFDSQLKNGTKNFVQADAAEAAKQGTLQQLADEKFGEII